MTRFRRFLCGILAGSALVVGAACTDVSDINRVEIDATGIIQGIVFLDNDGDGELTGQDTPQADLPVVLLSGGAGELRQETTDSLGTFRMDDVPAGSYRVSIAAEALGDSLQVTDPDGEEVVIQRGDTVVTELGISFPALKVEEVEDFPAGRRVFTSGIALNPRLPFGDGRVHVRGESRALRAVDVERLSLSTGDSVRLLGRTAVDGGGAVLEDVSAVVLVSQASIPLPRDISTGTAASADGGTMDAELVRIENAAITDTATVGADIRVTIDDGSGPVDVVLQSFLDFDRTNLVPDTIFAVGELTGLLVPRVETDGTVRWSVYPRGRTDLTLQTRQVDVAISMAGDFRVATRNDTVTFTLVARNLGTQSAEGVEVLDSLPVGIGLLQATSTRGTFQSAGGVWTLGEMGLGASDTLRLVTRVNTSVTGTFTHRARIRTTTSQLDVSQGNNVAQAQLTVVPPGQKQTDLQLELTADRTSVEPGDTVVLTATALNGGSIKVSAIQIADSLTAGLELVEGTPSVGSYDAGTGVWTLDSIPVAGSETLTLTVVVVQESAGTVTPRVVSLGTQRETDPQPDNDRASVTLTVSPSSQGVEARVEGGAGEEGEVPAADGGRGEVIRGSGDPPS